MKPPEDWHGGWIVATWVGAALALLIALQLLGLEGGRRAAAGPRSHLPAFLLAAGSLLLVAGPFYLTVRWLRERSEETPRTRDQTNETPGS